MPTESAGVEAGGTPAISAPKIEAAKGGGAVKGIGETFQPNAFTGTATFSVPIETEAARGAQPKLSLDYSSGAGNGIFGLGFSVDLPSISRRTERGIPTYTASDTFILSDGAELVPTGPMVPDGSGSRTQEYRPRTEGGAAKIEQILDETSGISYWRTTSRENITAIYGKTTDTRIADPADPTRIFEWLIEETVDAKGNRTEYSYASGPDAAANRYPTAIRFGNYTVVSGDVSETRFALKIAFDYSDSGSIGPLESPSQIKPRLDSFSSYRSGFEIRTELLCRQIQTIHEFDGVYDGEPFLVRALQLHYDENRVVSQLTSIQQVGYQRQDDGTYLSKAMPPVDLAYSAFDPSKNQFHEIVIEGDSKPQLLNDSGYQLVALMGDGLPGILFSNDHEVLYWRNLGGGSFGGPVSPFEFPIERNLNRDGQALFDLSGDGRLDLVIGTPQRGGYYAQDEDASWAPYRAFQSYPVAFAKGDKMWAAGEVREVAAVIAASQQLLVTKPWSVDATDAEFKVMPQSDTVGGETIGGPGTLTFVKGLTNVSGNGADFSLLAVGAEITCEGETRTVAVVVSEEELLVSKAWTVAATDAAYTLTTPPTRRTATNFPPYPGTGTVTIVANVQIVDGSGTKFPVTLSLGEQIRVEGQTRSVLRILSDDQLLVDRAWTTTENNVPFTVIPVADGAERLMVFFGTELPTSEAFDPKPPEPPENPGKDPFLISRADFNDGIYHSVLLAQRAKDLGKGDVTAGPGLMLREDLRYERSKFLTLDYEYAAKNNLQPYGATIDRGASELLVTPAENLIANNYWGEQAPMTHRQERPRPCRSDQTRCRAQTFRCCTTSPRIKLGCSTSPTRRARSCSTTVTKHFSRPRRNRESR